MAATFRRTIDRDRRTLIGARILVSLLTLLTLNSNVRAQRPATTRPAAQIATWVEQLADPDAAVREKARDQMLGLTAGDLPTLRKVLTEASALMPAQKVSLRDVVEHVYLMSLPYERSPDDNGFLGVKWPNDLDPRVNELGLNAIILSSRVPDFTAESLSGVVVARRLRGFPAYGTLRDGDIITRLVNTGQDFASDPEAGRKPEDQVAEQLLVVTPMRLRFIDAMKNFKAGDAVVFDILRNGKPMTVRAELAARPAVASQAGSVDDWLEDREQQAEKYWDSNFRSIVKDDPTPISMAR